MKSTLGILVAMGTLGAGVYLMMGGHLPHAPQLSGSRRRRHNLRGHDEQKELEIFIENDGQLYRQQTVPIMKNLQKKLAKGVFDKTKAEKLWMYLVENGAKKYAKEFGGTWHQMFSMADRKAVAKALAESFVNEYVS